MKQLQYTNICVSSPQTTAHTKEYVHGSDFVMLFCAVVSTIDLFHNNFSPSG